MKFYLDLKKKKENEEEKRCAPVERQAHHGAKSHVISKRKQVNKELMKKNLEKECRREFKEIVGKSIVLKWVRAAEKEKWFELPEAVRTRMSTTGNSWRRKHGIPVRARQPGGCVPYPLQVELDRLVMEITQGCSDVTERREIVTAEHIVSRFR